MSEELEYNFAGDLEESSGGDWTNPELGSHPARIHSLTFLDRYAATFKGKKKDPTLMVAVRFAIYDEEEDEETEEITVKPCEGRNFLTKVFSFKWSDKGHFPLMLAALYPKQCTVKTKPSDEVFNKMITKLVGKACTVDIVADGKEMDGDKPKYVKINTVTKIALATSKLVPQLDEEEAETSKITMYKDITETQLRYLKGYEIRRMIEEGENFQGSTAQAVLAEIREEDPDFAINVESDKPEKKEKPSSKPDKPAQKDEESEENLDDDEEF